MKFYDFTIKKSQLDITVAIKAKNHIEAHKLAEERITPAFISELVVILEYAPKEIFKVYKKHKLYPASHIEPEGSAQITIRKGAV